MIAELIGYAIGVLLFLVFAAVALLLLLPIIFFVIVLLIYMLPILFILVGIGIFPVNPIAGIALIGFGLLCFAALGESDEEETEEGPRRLLR